MEAFDLTSETVPEAPPVRPAVVYADCRAALEIAWQNGLSRDVPVRSVAPAVLADTAIGAEPAVDHLSPGNISLFTEALVATVHDVWQALRGSALMTDVEDAEQIALVAIRTVLTDLQNEIFVAALLREEDFSAETIAVIILIAMRSDIDDQPITRRHLRIELVVRDPIQIAEVRAVAGHDLANHIR